MKITYQQIKTIWSHTRRLGLTPEQVYRVLFHAYQKERLHHLTYYEASEWIYDLAHFVRSCSCHPPLNESQIHLERMKRYSQEPLSDKQIHRIVLLLKSIRRYDPNRDLIFDTECFANQLSYKLSAHYLGWRKLNKWQSELLIRALQKELTLIKEIIQGGQHARENKGK